MLIVLRSDLSGLLGARPLEADLRLVVELDSGDLMIVGLGLDGARSLAGDEDREVSFGTGRLFRVFGTGRGGTDAAGGVAVGRDG